MDLIAILGFGGAMFFNFLSVLWKVRNNQIINGILDGILFISVMALTAGSLAGMAIGTVASALLSIYLIFDPVNLDIFKKRSKEERIIMFLEMLPFKEAKKKAKKFRKKLKKKAKKKDRFGRIA